MLFAGRLQLSPTRLRNAKELIMKSLRLMLAVVLVSLATVALAQSDAQKSFNNLKALAGTWNGTATITPPHPEWGNELIWVSMRVTSRGNLLVHEMKKPGTPDDLSKDDPITTMYLDQGQLTLTHYCDAGNRPRMTAKTSPDGKKIEFDFLDVAGSTQYGHMHHAVFTIIDDNHHTEEWTFMEPGDKMVHAVMDLKRAN